MADNKTTQAQQSETKNAQNPTWNAWQRAFEKQAQLIAQTQAQLSGMAVKGMEQSASAYQELTNLNQDVVEQLSALHKTQDHLNEWRKTLDKQTQTAAKLAEKFTSMQQEQSKTAVSAIHDLAAMSKNAFEQATELSKAWTQAAQQTGEQLTSWGQK